MGDSANARIEAVLFDADGVIQTASRKRRNKLRTLLPPGADAEGFWDELFEVERPALTGSGSLQENLEALLQRWCSRAHPAEVLEMLNMVEVHKGILGAITLLRESGIKCYLASNQQIHRARHMSVRLGYRNIFDAEFYSCYLGYAKPSREYFLHVLDGVSLEPKKVLFLDDNDENINGAREAGLNASRFVLSRSQDNLHSLLVVLSQYGLRVGAL